MNVVEMRKRAGQLIERNKALISQYGDGDVKAMPADVQIEIYDNMNEAKGILAQVQTKIYDEDLHSATGRPFAQPGGESRGASFGGGKSLGEMFVESAAYKDRQNNTVAELDVELKTLFQTTAGWAPQSIRGRLVVEDEQRPVQVTDIIPQVMTDQAAVVYMEETTFTNAAAETAEAGTFPESALVLTERTSTARKISTWLPVTDEQLADVAQASGYVNNRLTFMLKQRLDGQIITGNGTAPNLTGILNVAGIQTQAKGADPVPDAVRKAFDLIRLNGRAEPSHVLMHTSDIQDLQLLRTADGLYIWGHPATSSPDSIWGVPIVRCDSLTAGTALAGDFRNFSLLAVRQGVEVEVTNAHSTFFIEGKQAIRATIRVALATLRPLAFCTVTGI